MKKLFEFPSTIVSSEFKKSLESLGCHKERLEEEIKFASSLAAHRSDKRGEWEKLINQALDKVKDGLTCGTSLHTIVEEAERIMAPIGQAAKEYTIHYVGHAHLDMNWLWDWSETAEAMYQTFSTMDKLMDEFPDFLFSQSSAVDYATVEKYSPYLFDRIQRRVKEGRWEITASTWVEGDKNMALGEALIRQILYAKRYFARKFGLDFNQIRVGWEPDTFGHPWTYPQIMRLAGIDYYYINRGGKEHRLFWWESPDGSRVLVWNDGKYLDPNPPQQRSVRYHRRVEAEDAVEALEHENKTGMKDYIMVCGLGDHGGGPTRRYLQKIEELAKWPIFPKVKFSTVKEYFDLAQKYADNLPVVKDELNFPFRGCYSSQSKIKYANRKAENDLPTAETLALIAQRLTTFDYPKRQFEESWQKLCFNQFHDILPGAGIKETYEYAQGNHQEVQALTSLVREQALEAIATSVNTRGEGIPMVVFNFCPWERTDKVEIVIYEPPEGAKEFVVVDEEGSRFPFQIYGSSELLRKKIEREGQPFATRPIGLFFDAHQGHEYIQGCFTAPNVPAWGCKAYWLRQEPALVKEDRVKVNQENNKAVLENEFYRLEIDGRAGALIRLYDKAQKREFVPEGEKMGLLSICYEAPHEMSAWEIGPITHLVNLDSGGKIEVKEEGPVRGIIQYQNKYNDSTFVLNIILQRGIPEIRFNLEVNWLERGGPDCGVPSLKVIFPVAVATPQPTFEIPFGSIERPANGQEVPAQRWLDLRDAQTGAGITLVNDHTYGHCVDDNKLFVTLLRSSYEPDPLPELGKHRINYSIFTHDGNWSPAQATRQGIGFNLPFIARRVDPHPGKQCSYGFVSVEPAHVIATCLKLAEDNDNIIVRLNEVNGKSCLARIKMAWEITEATEVDPLEQPLNNREGSIKTDGQGRLEVKMKPHEIKTLSLRVK